MIEMHEVVMLELGTVQQVADNACVVGNIDFYCGFDCPHRGQSVGVRSDAAGALYEVMGIAGIAPLEDHFDAAEHLPGAPGIHHLAAGHFHLDAKMAFDSGNRIDGYSFTHIMAP
jgi:hypothetical protein